MTSSGNIDNRGTIIGPTIGLSTGHVETNYNISYRDVQPQPVDPQTLAAAEALLATMPTDRVADLAPLPTPHRMPYDPNQHFVGREQDLRAIGDSNSNGAENVAKDW